MLNFIYNPNAGSGKAAKCYKTISAELKKRNIPHIFHNTCCKGHATQLANQITSAGYRDIVIMGGDGTIHETLNGIIDPSSVRLGIIPCGSGNDFAASSKIPSDPVSALDIILSDKSKYIDYMECSGVRGINIIGTGIDLEILKRCYKYKMLKGKLKYIISTISSLIKYDCTQIEAITDNTASHHKFFIMCAANGKYFGGHIPIAPNAQISDGKLDFVLVNDMPGIKKAGALVKLLQNKILTLPETLFQSTSCVKAISNVPIDIEIDGEIYSNLKFNVSVIHNKLRLFSK